MPLRNQVPSLHLMAVRKVVWPDGINRDEIDAYPCAEQYCRDTIYSPYIASNGPKLVKWLGSMGLKNVSNAAINAWIHLSNYYEAPLHDLKQLGLIFTLSPPQVLDFLGEGEVPLLGEGDKDNDAICRHMITPLRRVISQPITPSIWTSIVSLLESQNGTEKVKELSVYLSPSSEDDDAAAYNFSFSMEGFSNLSKLVVRGAADDELLAAVGHSCLRLKYLDVSGTPVTAVGVKLLFFKDAASELRYVKLFKASNTNYKLPKNLLRPLSKSIEYLDFSNCHKIPVSLKIADVLLVACPQLVATSTRFFFKPKGEVKIICRDFEPSPTLMPLRQSLVMHVRSGFCENIFCLVRGLLACHSTNAPTFQVRVNEIGAEVGFLLFSNERLLALAELENLSVINFTSFARSACAFIPIDLLGHFAPNLERIKASLKGVVGDKYPLPKLKQVSIPIAHNLATLKSLLQNCPALEYLEIRELLLHPDFLRDEDMEELFEMDVPCLQIFRLGFKNKISLVDGLSSILRACPQLRLVGDLAYWAVGEKSFYRLHKQIRFHNFNLLIEYDGVVFNSCNSCGEFIVKR